MDNVTLFLLPTFIISVSCIFIISLKHKRYKVKELINKFVADKVDNVNEVKLCVQYGLERTMNCGEKARVIDYIGCKNATIQFEDDTIRYNVRIDDFKRGQVAKNSKRGVNKK